MSSRLPGLYPSDVEVSAIPTMPSDRIVSFVGQLSNGPTDRPFMISRDDLSQFRPLSDVSGSSDFLFLSIEETLKVAQYVYCARVATTGQKVSECTLNKSGSEGSIVLKSKYASARLNGTAVAISKSSNHNEIVLAVGSKSYNFSVSEADDNYIMYLNDSIPEIVIDGYTPTATKPENTDDETAMQTYYTAVKTELIGMVGSFEGGSAGYVGTLDDISENFSTACKLFSDKETSDPFLIMSPGVTDVDFFNMMLETVSLRSGDCKIMVDCKNSANVDTIIKELESLRNMYCEAVAGWGIYYDKYLKKDVVAPPSVGYGRAFIEAVGIKYFGSVAGTARGVLSAFKGIAHNYTHSQKILLQEACINPLILKNKLPTVYNNLNMIKKTSVFMDTNVTNIHVTVKKAILASTDQFVFEDNNTNTWARWKTMMTPIMDEIYSKGGFYDYKLLMGIDDGTMTSTDIDTKVMRGVVKYKPTREASYIEIPFTAYSYSTEFED